MYNRLLDTFAQVARAGSFTKAAQGLYVTPSAVLQQMRSLEAELGVRLFERSPRGVELTQAGVYLLEQCEEAFVWNRRVRERLAQIEGAGRRTVRIGESYIMRATRLMEAWQGFSRSHPGFSMHVAYIGSDFKGMEDVDLVEGPVTAEAILDPLGFEFTRLDEVPIGIVYADGAESVPAGGLRYDDLSGVTVVTIEAADAALDEFEQRAATAGAQIRKVHAYTPATLSECALNGWLLQVPMCWGGVVEGMRAVPLVGAPRVAFGVFSSAAMSAASQEYLEYVTATYSKEMTQFSL